MEENRKNFLDGLKVDKVPVISNPNDINYDFVQSVSQKQAQIRRKQERYTAQQGTLNKAKKKGISLTAVALVAGLLAMGTIVALPKVKEWKEEQKEIERQEEILQQINEKSEEYEGIEDITQTLQKAKGHYEMGYNAKGEPITEENMNEELKNIKELIKTAYKMRIGEACGVKPEDVSKIVGVQERITDIDDIQVRVSIPKDISPTGERIDFIDEEVPEDMASLIRIASSVDTNLDFRYNNSSIVWGRAVAGLGTAVGKTQVRYNSVIDGEDITLVVSEENNKAIDGFEIGD